MGWPEVLADMGNRVTDTRRFLQQGGQPPQAFVLPDDLGPLPDELRLAAAALLADTHRAEAEVEMARDRLGSPARIPVPAAPPAYVDTRA